METDVSQGFFVYEPCWMRLAAKDKEDVWNVCDGDTLYLYERERITNNKQ